MITLLVHILAFLFVFGATAFFVKVYQKLKNKEIFFFILAFGYGTVLRFAHIINYHFELGIAPKIAGLFLVFYFLCLLGSRGIYRSICKVLGK